jgi:hypothetical protein
MKSLALGLALAIALNPIAALAENCRLDYGPLTDLPRGIVVKKKAHFISGACSDDPSAPACRITAYLIKGDVVFMGPANGFLRCVGYLGKGGRYTEGWIETAAIRPW